MTVHALAPLDRDRQRSHKLRNALQSVLLIGGMVLLLAACGWAVAGLEGLVLIAVFGAVGLLLSLRVSSKLVLQLFGAVPLTPGQVPELHAVLRELSRRAGLEQPPALYYVASPTLNAFSVGRRDSAVVAITGGLLRSLSLRELVGVLAHELSHVRQNDMWVMGLADMISRMTRTMSLLGLFLLVVNLPLLLAGMAQISWLLVLLLIFAPTLGSLLQLALSRTREFDADLDAAGLTGDPVGLASALEKLERYQGRFWEEILLPGRRIPEPSVLRTHPATEERVKRLLDLRGRRPLAAIELPDAAERHRNIVPAFPLQPRWRRSGLWY